MHSELGEVRIALLNSITGPHVRVVLAEWFNVFLEQCVLLSGRAALELRDVVHVRPAEDEEATQESHEPALSLIVEAIGLVPLGELADVLVGELGLVTWLEAVPRKVRIDILLWQVREGGVGTLVRVRILESGHSTGGAHHGCVAHHSLSG